MGIWRRIGKVGGGDEIVDEKRGGSRRMRGRPVEE